MGSGEGGDAAAGGRSPAASAVGESSLPPQQLQQQQQQQQGGAGRGLSGAGTQQLAEQGLETPATASGPQFHIVDGQIVVDQSSLLVDRHAAAAAAHAGQDMEEIEENDFTRLTTSASYMTGSKLRGPNHWSDADTERFYEYLAMFGTDFETISMMFPGKSRRAIKMKFNREEKVRPRRITAAVVGKKHVAIDLEHFRRRAGGELESLESIKSELADHESTWNAKFEDARRAHEEEMQRKKDELFAEEEEGGGGGEGAAAAAGDGENGRQGKGRKKGGGAGYRGRGRKGIQT
jgi:transcription factor TFIIIB component B''